MRMAKLRRILKRIRRRKSKKLWEVLFGTYELDFSGFKDKDFRDIAEGLEGQKGIEILWKEKKIRIGNISPKTYLELAKTKL